MEKQEKIVKTPEGNLDVPDVPIIPFIEGDGIGPDIWHAAQMVLDSAVNVADEGKKKISWLPVPAGEKGYQETGEWLPEQTLETIKSHVVAIKGPLTTPVGEGIRSLNVTIRQRLDLYACVRPVKYISGVPNPMKQPEKVDMVIFRENTEDVYAGIEWESETDDAKRIIAFLKEKNGCASGAGFRYRH
jgi:isocitrate dehydrogenase